MEKIKLLTRISYLLVTVLCALFAYEHIHRIYQLESKLVNQKLHSLFNNLNDDLNRVKVNAGSSLTVLESILNERMKIDGKVPKEYLKNIMAPLLASRRNQHSFYFALEPEIAERIFHVQQAIISVHKDISRTGTEEYNNLDTFQLEEFNHREYLKNETWYLLGKKNREVQMTPIYYDKNVLDVWMFSFIKGLYSDNKFGGVVGVDYFMDSFLEHISREINRNEGALALIDNRTQKVFTHPNQKTDFQFTGLNFREVTGKDISNRTFNNEKDGKHYILNSFFLRDFGWTIVTVIKKDLIYAEVFSKVQWLLVICFLVLLFNLLIVFLLFKYINRFYFEVITQNQSRGITRLTEGLCHEINNPLATLSLCQGALKRLLKSENHNSSINGLMTKSEKASERIQLIIQKLQNISFTSSELDLKPTSMGDIVEELKMIFSEDLSKYHISLTLDATEGAIIICDPLKILQALMPLVENSIEELRESDERWIRIEVSKKNNASIICFVDSGHGIKNGIRERIFLPFFTTKTRELKKGLGLTITKSFIEQQGGTISYLESEKYTTFRIVLPFTELARE